MMNYLFPLFILLSVLFSVFNGSADATASALLEGGYEAITLSLTLMGGMCLWGGLMNIARSSGLTGIISGLLSPVLCRLMPSLKSNRTAREHVSMNVVSNLLGLGNAATPLGIMAMQELNRRPTTDKASADMITFVVLNTASIQLIPSTLALLRSQAGSLSPLEILPCVWISSIASVTVGLLICKAFSLERRKTHKWAVISYLPPQH